MLPTAQAKRRDRRGWVTLPVQFDDESEARFVVLGFGRRVEVIEPAGLRNRIAEEVVAMFARQSER